MIGQQGGAPPPRLGYIIWRFPKISETFILREMTALEQLGWTIDVFPFIVLDEDVRHPAAERWMAQLPPPPAWPEVCQAYWTTLRRSPGVLLSLYVLLVSSLWREPRELARGLVALGRAVVWARHAQERGIVHVHAHFARHPAVAALAMARLAGITYSFTGHSHDIYRHPAMLATKVRGARFVVTVSRLVRDHYIAPLVSAAELAKVHVVRCGVDTAAYRPRRSEPPCAHMILAVGRLIEVKGLMYLIEAVRLLRERGLAVSLEIIGEGPLRASLEQQVKTAGLSDSVMLRGAQPQAEVQRALEWTAMLVLPSIVTTDGTMEGVPVSLMEAMASGVPIVATRTGAISELVQNCVTGLLVEPRNASALADAIAQLLDDRMFGQRLADAARDHVLADFDLAVNVERLHHLLVQTTGVESDAGTPAHPLVSR